MPFRFHPLEIPEVILIETQKFADARGFFMETYKQSELSANGIPTDFVQDNYSYSSRSVLRGLHYQKPPAAQGKLVIVLQGTIFDVAVDIRPGSPSYGAGVGRELAATHGQMLYVPAGFAHGFCVLSETAAVLYKVTAEYAPALERGIIWNDPEINIRWPHSDPILSDKDARLPLLRDADVDPVHEKVGI